MSRSERSKAVLLETAARVLAENPGISLAEVASRAGIGRATLYRHFPSREQLIQALAERSIEELDQALAGVYERSATALEYFQGMMDAVVPLGDRYHFLSREWDTLTDPVLRKSLDRQMQGLEETVEALKAEGAIALDVPTAWAVAAIDSLIYAAWSSVHEGRVARREAAQLAVRTLLDGLSPR